MPSGPKAKKGAKPSKVKTEEESEPEEGSTSVPSRTNSAASIPSSGWAMMPMPGAAEPSEPPSPKKKTTGTARTQLKKAEKKQQAPAKYGACRVCQKLPDALPAPGLISCSCQLC